MTHRHQRRFGGTQPATSLHSRYYHLAKTLFCYWGLGRASMKGGCGATIEGEMTRSAVRLGGELGNSKKIASGMPKSRQFIAMLCLLCAAGLMGNGLGLAAEPSSAAMRPSKESSTARTVHAPRYLRFMTRGSNGYRIVVTSSYLGTSVTAVRGHSAVQVSTPFGRVTKSRLEADFGGYGQIVVRFRWSGSITRNAAPGEFAGCTPVGPVRDKLGVFVGAIRFRGERGFTRVNRTRAVGRMAAPRRLTCPPGARGLRPPGKRRTVGLRSPRISVLRPVRFAVGDQALQQLQLFDPSLLALAGVADFSYQGVSFMASSFEERLGLAIQRVVLARGGKSSFAVDRTLRRARIQPPAPFSGAATVIGCPTTWWRGSLAVRFPGRKVRLVQGDNQRTLLFTIPGAQCP